MTVVKSCPGLFESQIINFGETKNSEKQFVTVFFIIFFSPIDTEIDCFISNHLLGPSIKYVSTFSVIFDTPLPHVSNCQHFNNQSLKSTSAFSKLSPPPFRSCMKPCAAVLLMSLIFKKNADRIFLETPTPLMLKL